MHKKLIIFDIGARGGLESIIPGWIPSVRPMLPFRKLFDTYGFEPDPEEIDKLKRAMDYAQVFGWAVGKESGIQSLYVTAEPDKSSILEPDLEIIKNNFIGNYSGYELSKILQVQCRNLDEIAEELGIFPDWIKIDTQGSEMDILEGAPRCLSAASVLFLELSSISQYKSQKSIIESMEFLLANGYDIAACNWKPMAPYENDFVFFKRITKDSGDRLIRSVGACLAILGLDKQVDMILSSEKYTQFHKQLRRYCRNAALHPYKIKANQYKTRGIQWAARHLNEKTKLKIKSWLKK